MNRRDLCRIEESLDIRLPESYRQIIVEFPIPAAAGNSDTAVWDDADRLIEFNRELRQGGGPLEPWPHRFYAIGHPGDGSPQAIDLEDGDAVWWVDCSHLKNPSSYREAESFHTWAEEYFTSLREEMMGEGIDPDGTPIARAVGEAKAVREQGLALFLLLVVAVILVAGLVWLIR